MFLNYRQNDDLKIGVKYFDFYKKIREMDVDKNEYTTDADGKLFTSIFKLVLFTILFNKKKRTVYYARAFGILNAMLGKKSFYRSED